MEINELRRAVGARLGYCFRQDPKDKFFAWHVRFPGPEGKQEIRSYPSEVMNDIPKWTWDLNDAISLVHAAAEKGFFFEFGINPTEDVETWGGDAKYKPIDSDHYVLVEGSLQTASGLAEVICRVFCAVMPEIGQE